MYQDDYFNPASSNDYDDDDLSQTPVMLKILKKQDRGLNTLTRYIRMESGFLKQKRIKVYTSSGVGSKIRDAETGEFYTFKVGSKDEDLFFKVIISTGECKSANGYNTLFYFSPHHYENHLDADVDPETFAKWENKHNARLKEIKKQQEQKYNMVAVK